MPISHRPSRIAVFSIAHKGYSLLEALTVLVIAAVLARFALFATEDWLARQRATSLMHTLHAAVNLSRQTAASLNVRVVVCPAGTGDSCGPRDSWHNGVLIFADQNRNRRPDAGEPVVARLPGFDHGTLRWRSFRNRSYLVFTARGITDWQNGHLRYCPQDGDPRWARQLVLNAVGRVYPSADRDGDGIHEDASGEPLTCA